MNHFSIEPLNSEYIKKRKSEFSEQLIILGNGFDLACGLKSSYSDFFDYIFLKESQNNNYWYRVFDYTNKNDKHKNHNWTDIEFNILMELQNLEFLFHFNLLHDVKKEIENNESLYSDFYKKNQRSDNDILQLVNEFSRVTELDKKIYNFLTSHTHYDYLNFHSVVGTASILLLYSFNFISSIVYQVLFVSIPK
ncbi:AbiH family protein [Streptococcus sanguinis]|uniref:AbiH family protein n=1 Tax=Streptococcus sanguinis TaxID=1305 RepID=UPI001D142BBC|nr:AbiH family protein [Streptococcus sanguinis]MCC3173495.1 bacteriophage abortive infection AbiH family protein [Streptococcus sanguinis]